MLVQLLRLTGEALAQDVLQVKGIKREIECVKGDVLCMCMCMRERESCAGPITTTHWRSTGSRCTSGKRDKERDRVCV